MLFQKFSEKEAKPSGNIANAAIYIFEKEFLERIRKDNKEREDIAQDLLQGLQDELYTCFIEDIFIDVGRLDRLKKARKLLRNRI